MTAGHTERAADDPRFTVGLLADVRAVLKRHGYVESQEPASHAHMLADLLQLARSYEGHQTDDSNNGVTP